VKFLADLVHASRATCKHRSRKWLCRFWRQDRRVVFGGASRKDRTIGRNWGATADWWDARLMLHHVSERLILGRPGGAKEGSQDRWGWWYPTAGDCQATSYGKDRRIASVECPIVRLPLRSLQEVCLRLSMSSTGSGNPAGKEHAPP
jgi:hypothetical protein